MADTHELFLGALFNEFSNSDYLAIDGEFLEELLLRHGYIRQGVLTADHLDPENEDFCAYAYEYGSEPGDQWNFWSEGALEMRRKARQD